MAAVATVLVASLARWCVLASRAASALFVAIYAAFAVVTSARGRCG